MEEVLTIRLPKGTRRRLERRAKAQKLSVSQLVRRALEQDELFTSLAAARSELLPHARARTVYTDEDVFAIVSRLSSSTPTCSSPRWRRRVCVTK
jgi:predicted transcriptional regulator